VRFVGVRVGVVRPNLNSLALIVSESQRSSLS